MVAVEPQQIKGTGNRLVLKAAAVQPIEVGPTVCLGPDHLRVQHGRYFDAPRLVYDEGIGTGAAPTAQPALAAM
jgi:hypothetical protein